MWFVVFLLLAFAFDLGTLFVGFRTLAGRASRFEEIVFWPLLPLGIATTLSVSLLFLVR
jgi:hypothetical protein